MLLLINNLYSQYDWSVPLPVTDSISNNTNPDLVYTGQVNYVMTWEKSIDSSSTSIYIKNIIGQEDEIEVLSDENIHYTHPKIFPVYDYYGMNDTIFFLFYETDQAGNKDIYYLVYTSDGNFSEPNPFFISMYDDFDMNTWGSHLVWVQDEKLFWTKYVSSNPNGFTEPSIIDEGGCYNPAFVLTSLYDPKLFVIWEKKIGSLSHIYVAEEQGSNWSEPIVIYDSGYAINLNCSELGSHFAWSAFTDLTWKILACHWDNVTGSWITTQYNIEQTNPFDPAVAPFNFLSYYPELAKYISFPYAENGHEEIYMNLDPYLPSFTNFSSSTTDNRNPNFFDRYYYQDYRYIYNVWESYRNGHWQIFYSKILLAMVKVVETKKEIDFFNISPNPSKSTITISYFLEKNNLVNIGVFDLQGNKIATVLEEFQYKGKQSVKWSIPGEAAPGIYLILLRKDNELYSQKIIKTD